MFSTTSFKPPVPSAGGADALIDLFRALADPIRLRLLRLLEIRPVAGEAAQHGSVAGGAGGLSVGELSDILKLPQSTVSRHLKTLTDAGQTDVRREGTSMYYRLAHLPDSAAARAGEQLRTLAREYLAHDAAAKNDAHRLAAILRRREETRAAHGPAESFFGKHAGRWDQLRTQWFGDTFHLEALLALLNPGWTVADIGAGTGAMLPLLSPYVKKIIAVDPSPAMLKGARTRVNELGLANVEVRQGAAGGGEPLPIDKGSVNVALLALVLAYTPDPPGVLCEIRRILAPGGILLIIDLQPHAVELFRTELNHVWMGFPQDELFGWLKEAGFRNLRWHPLAAKTARTKTSAGGSDSTPVPDLFALRAETPLTTESQSHRGHTEGGER